ncbi:MAG: CopD family protein [Rubrivivax sp.]|jgi:uncharacterized membrane protein|nr:CopD family protein [Rubrivivax sp.]
MVDALLKLVHVAAVVVWIGGMVFAHFFLRPALGVLEPPQRTALMSAVLGRFFAAVMVASLAVWASGLWMIGRAAKQVVQSGGSFAMPGYWWAMALLGTVMVAIFLHIRFAPYRRLRAAVGAGQTAAAAAALAQVRQWVGVNLAIGIAILVVTLLRWPV